MLYHILLFIYQVCINYEADSYVASTEFALEELDFYLNASTAKLFKVVDLNSLELQHVDTRMIAVLVSFTCSINLIKVQDKLMKDLNKFGYARLLKSIDYQPGIEKDEVRVVLIYPEVYDHYKVIMIEIIKTFISVYGYNNKITVHTEEESRLEGITVQGNNLIRKERSQMIAENKKSIEEIDNFYLTRWFQDMSIKVVHHYQVKTRKEHDMKAEKIRTQEFKRLRNVQFFTIEVQSLGLTDSMSVVTNVQIKKGSTIAENEFIGNYRAMGDLVDVIVLRQDKYITTGATKATLDKKVHLGKVTSTRTQIHRSEIKSLIILPTDQILVRQVRHNVLNKELFFTIKLNPLQSYLLTLNMNELLNCDYNTDIYLPDTNSTSSSITKRHPTDFTTPAAKKPLLESVDDSLSTVTSMDIIPLNTPTLFPTRSKTDISLLEHAFYGLSSSEPRNFQIDFINPLNQQHPDALLVRIRQKIHSQLPYLPAFLIFRSKSYLIKIYDFNQIYDVLLNRFKQLTGLEIADTCFQYKFINIKQNTNITFPIYSNINTFNLQDSISIPANTLKQLHITFLNIKTESLYIDDSFNYMDLYFKISIQFFIYLNGSLLKFNNLSNMNQTSHLFITIRLKMSGGQPSHLTRHLLIVN